MSTPNFAIPNASRYFAFGSNKYMDQECIDANDYPQEWLGNFDEIQTQCDFEWALEDCKSQFKEKGWQEIDESVHDLSYPEYYFARKRACFTYAGAQVKITADAGYQSGYYEGANFDWRLEIEVENDTNLYWAQTYELEEITPDACISDNWCGNRGFSKVHAKNIVNMIRKSASLLTSEAETIFASCSEHELVRVAVFSNGEAVYEDANSTRAQLKAAVAA